MRKWHVWESWWDFKVKKFKKGEENYNQPKNAKIMFFILIAVWIVAAIVAAALRII